MPIGFALHCRGPLLGQPVNPRFQSAQRLEVLAWASRNKLVRLGPPIPEGLAGPPKLRPNLLGVPVGHCCLPLDCFLRFSDFTLDAINALLELAD